MNAVALCGWAAVDTIGEDSWLLHMSWAALEERVILDNPRSKSCISAVDQSSGDG